MSNRSYKQYCGLAYALDIVGERWTLLIVRELIPGPRRFTDLMDGLPGISTNLLSERLKSLEQQGLLCRRVLPPPAGSAVYELTSLGQALQKSLIELGKWGSQFVPAAAEDASLLNVGSYALTLKTFFRPEHAQGVDETYELRIDNEVLQVQINAGQIQVQQGEALKADVIFRTEMPTYLGLLQGQIRPEEAISKGMIQIWGNGDQAARIEDDRIDDDRIGANLSALRRFLNICGLPGSH
jgi:DNA-binding HxlR family transcriptional regulator